MEYFNKNFTNGGSLSFAIENTTDIRLNDELFIVCYQLLNDGNAEVVDYIVSILGSPKFVIYLII
jgi:hypothetical protein